MDENKKPTLNSAKAQLENRQNGQQDYSTEFGKEQSPENINSTNKRDKVNSVFNLEVGEEFAQKHNTTNKDSSRNKKNDRQGKNNNQKGGNSNVEFSQELTKKNK